MSWDFENGDKGYVADDHAMFIEILSDYLTDQELLDKVSAVYKEHWPKISQMQASSSGKYHHWTEQTVPYGLLNHVIRGMYFCEHLSIEEAGFTRKKSDKKSEAKFQRLKNNRLAAMAVHDFGKMKVPHIGHGVYVHPYLKPHGFDKKIRLMAQNHMHNWTKKYVAETRGQVIVAYADYLASQKEIHIGGVRYLMEVNGKPEIVLTVSVEPIAGVKVNIKG